MNINRNNYESWLLDYLDDNLTAEEKHCVEEFLSVNPDIHEEFQQVQEFKIEPPETTFKFKHSLKKQELIVEPTGIDSQIIAAIENDLSEKETLELKQQMIADEETLNTYKLFQLTKLQANDEITFSGKQKLRQPIPLSSYNNNRRVMFAVAAALIIIFISVALLSIFNANRSVIDVASNDSNEELQKNELISKQVNRNEALKTEMETLSNLGKSEVDNVSKAEPDAPLSPAPPMKTTNEIKRSVADKEIRSVEIAALQPNQPELMDQKAISNTIYTDPLNVQIQPQNQEYLSLGDGLATLAKKELARSIENEGNAELALEDDSYKKVRLLDVVGLGIGKLSKNKVKLNPAYNENGELVSYKLKAGDVGLEKRR